MAAVTNTTTPSTPPPRAPSRAAVYRQFQAHALIPKPKTAGYLAATGCWTARMAEALAEVDPLGVEFNHDVEMQRASGATSFAQCKG